MKDTAWQYLDAMGVDLWQKRCGEAGSRTASWQNASHWQLPIDRFCEWLLSQTVAQQQNLHSNAARLLLVSDWQLLDEQTQRVFAGESGNLLDAMLKAIDLTREQVALVGLTNPVSPKPGNAYWQNIAGVLSGQSFRLVLFMCKLPDSAKPGDFSARVAPGETCAGIPLILSFHPAYLLSHPAAKRDAWEDLKQARSLLNR